MNKTNSMLGCKKKMKIELKPEYVTQKFKTKKEFGEWLADTTFKKLILSNLGQDVRKIWVAKSGEILHSDFQSSLYNGKFLNMAELSEFCPIEILEDGQWAVKMNLLVEKIHNSLEV